MKATIEQDPSISEAIEREQARLRNFIWKRVPDQADAEDILQDVFYEFVEAYRLAKSKLNKELRTIRERR